MKKCIAKKCEDCRLYLSWDMEGPEGLRKLESHCAIMILARELPRLRGAVDGAQAASNETRNRVMEFGGAAVETIRQIREIAPKMIVGGD